MRPPITPLADPPAAAPGSQAGCSPQPDVAGATGLRRTRSADGHPLSALSPAGGRQPGEGGQTVSALPAQLELGVDTSPSRMRRLSAGGGVGQRQGAEAGAGPGRRAEVAPLRAARAPLSITPATCAAALHASMFFANASDVRHKQTLANCTRCAGCNTVLLPLARSISLFNRRVSGIRVSRYKNLNTLNRRTLKTRPGRSRCSTGAFWGSGLQDTKT